MKKAHRPAGDDAGRKILLTAAECPALALAFTQETLRKQNELVETSFSVNEIAFDRLR